MANEDTVIPFVERAQECITLASEYRVDGYFDAASRELQEGQIWATLALTAATREQTNELTKERPWVTKR